MWQDLFSELIDSNCIDSNCETALIWMKIFQARGTHVPENQIGLHITWAMKLLRHWGRDKMARHFPDDIFTCIFLNDNVWIFVKISLNFVPTGQINNIPALVQIMAWRRPGDNPASREMLDRHWANVVTYVGATSANDVGPAWICPSVQCWHNVVTPPIMTLCQRNNLLHFVIFDGWYYVCTLFIWMVG